MTVNYDDERLAVVDAEKNQALNDTESMYGNMIEESDNYYNAQIDASKEWADKQSQLQQENTDFAIEKIEQQKEQANKDYIKEQSGAYVDWQKQSNQYGANAEQMAAQGLATGGYSESSQVSMYNTYQNRVAAARESYNKAVLNYDNAIKDAKLQNNSALAEIAYNALQQQLELSLQGFQYKNQLIETQSNKLLEFKNMYHSQYQDVLDQINTENALAEQIRQYNENKALQEKQLAQNQAQWEKEYDLKLKQFEEEKRQYNESLAASKASRSSSGSSKSSSGSSKSSSSSGTSKTAYSNSTGSAKTTYKTTGMKASDVLSAQQLKAYGFSAKDQIYSMNGKYYIKNNNRFIDISSLKSAVNAATAAKKKGTTSIKGEAY